MLAIGLGSLLAAHALDYATFVVMVVRHGIGSEANVLVATIAEDHGLALLTLAKTATVVLVAATVVVLRPGRPKLAAVVLSVGILAGSLGTISNLATI